MYTFDTASIRKLRGGTGPAVSSTVIALGVTSMLTDIASEMVAAVMPLYLVFALQLTPLQIGAIDSVYQGATTVARLAGGWLADRWSQHKRVAAIGYGVSALCKLGWLAAGNSAIALASVTAADRVGKGIRTPPRDAMISLASGPSNVGYSFGVHRAMDSFGALLGPLVAFAIFAFLPEAYDAVFVTSFFIALAGLAALLLLVPRKPVVDCSGSTSELGSRATLRGAAQLLSDRRFRALILAASLVALPTVADPFIYLQLQRTAEFPISWFPLLFLATALTFAILAVPAGRLADKVGKGTVMLFGYLFLLAAYVALLASQWQVASPVLTVVLLGAYYACTDGVLLAAVSAWLPPGLRASGFALVTSAAGMARLIGSALFGLFWQLWSLPTAVAVFALALAIAIVLTARFWTRLERL